MAALVDAPESDDPPSEVYARAQRDMRTEFWTDAARGFLTVVRGDTPDGKKVRLQAQYFFAVTLYRLRYYTEARRIFSLVAADGKHPLNREAGDWMQRRVCSG
jgi:outer membrane protein assembly factor BamD (BamD/ComL family)